MANPWNLTTKQWSSVLIDGTTPEGMAESIRGGESLPWTEVLLRCSAEGSQVLDLGCGRGDHSAQLALKQRRTTLVDWSAENLGFSRSLYAALEREARFCQADITLPLPFTTGSHDLVFSCGVFEYFTVPQIEAILREMFRISRNKVVVMVPNAASLPYRLGKWYMEKTGNWPWGGEVPSYSLRRLFRGAGSAKTEEFTLAARHSLNFLTMPFGNRLRRVLAPVLTPADESRAAVLRQGYLLVTVGQKATAAER